MDEYRVCGIRFHEEDATVVVAWHRLHAGCAEAPAEPKRRKIGMWAAMGSRGRMATGDVQRDTPA